MNVKTLDDSRKSPSQREGEPPKAFVRAQIAMPKTFRGVSSDVTAPSRHTLR